MVVGLDKATAAPPLVDRVTLEMDIEDALLFSVTLNSTCPLLEAKIVYEMTTGSANG